VLQNRPKSASLVAVTSQISLLQPPNGPFVDESATFLATFFLQWGSGQNLLEIGAGNGIISILIALKQPNLPISAYEIQPELAEIARKNCTRANVENVEIIAQDIRQPLKKSFDNIISNPPFYPVGKFRPSPIKSVRLAHSEETLSMPELFEKSASLLSKKGSLFLIYPIFRLSEIYENASKFSLHLQRLQFIHFSPGQNAQKALIQLGNRFAECQILPPLFAQKTNEKLKKEWLND